VQQGDMPRPRLRQACLRQVVGGTACAVVCFVIPPACALGLPRVPRHTAADGHVTYHEPLFPYCSLTAFAAAALALA
jgi:hypothetical protein